MSPPGRIFRWARAARETCEAQAACEASAEGCGEGGGEGFLQGLCMNAFVLVLVCPGVVT
jgi:hypothetical protein